jgi:hypothetical protein
LLPAILFICKIARCDLSQSNSQSNNYTHPSPFVQRAPRSLTTLLGCEEDLNEAIAYAYPCPKKRAEERQRFQQKAISRVFASDLNGAYWRHCITLNLGNGMSVSEGEAKRRLNYLRVRLLKAMFGNSWRRKGVNIRYLSFKQGTQDRGNQHFHVLMAIEGNHDWSDLRIAMEIQSIERGRSKKPWEKDAHLDWDWWKKDNAFMRYVSREATRGADRYDTF